MSDELLSKGLDRLGISYSQKQLGQLLTMVDEIMLFNPAYRLVSNTCLCERMMRRVNFLKGLIVRMGLGNVTIEAKSAEELDGEFDIVTSRAFHVLSDCYPVMERIRRENGKIVLYKAGRKSIEEELAELRGKGYSPTSSIVGLEVPFLNESRNLLILS